MAIELEPDHVSCYALQLALAPDEWAAPPRRGALRWRNRVAAASGRWVGQPSSTGLAEELLDAAGYRHYELSSWARPGRESRHNSAYWARSAYTGIGAGAHSYDGVGRALVERTRPRSLPRRREAGERAAGRSRGARRPRRARSRRSRSACGGSTGSAGATSPGVRPRPARALRRSDRRGRGEPPPRVGQRSPPAHAAWPPLRLRGLPRVPAGAGRLMLFPPATLQAHRGRHRHARVSPMGPTARQSGREATNAVGVIAFDAVEPVDRDEITDADARRSRVRRPRRAARLRRPPSDAARSTASACASRVPTLASPCASRCRTKRSCATSSVAWPASIEPAATARGRRRVLRPSMTNRSVRAADLAQQLRPGAARLQARRPQAQGARAHREPAAWIPPLAARPGGARMADRHARPALTAASGSAVPCRNHDLALSGHRVLTPIRRSA